MWNMPGEYLTDSGWTVALNEAESRTFQFWDSVVGIEKLVLTFVRAHREILMWSLVDI